VAGLQSYPLRVKYLLVGFSMTLESEGRLAVVDATLRSDWLGTSLILVGSPGTY